MAPNYTISGINGHLWQIDITQWERTVMQFVHLFLFLFDVGITLERGTDYENPQFQESETFSHDSVYRSRILSKIHFIRYLEVCTWKVLTLSGFDSPYSDFALAIPNVCHGLYPRISTVKDKCLGFCPRISTVKDKWVMETRADKE